MLDNESNLTDAERQKAFQALILWFESQDIMPDEAAKIMVLGVIQLLFIYRKDDFHSQIKIFHTAIDQIVAGMDKKIQ